MRDLEIFHIMVMFIMVVFILRRVYARLLLRYMSFLWILFIDEVQMFDKVTRERTLQRMRRHHDVIGQYRVLHLELFLVRR